MSVRLLLPVDRARDHVRGGTAAGTVTVVAYGDFLCPYCRRLTQVMRRIRSALGDRLQFVFRHFPNERAHPGATRLALVAEAAGKQRRFWELHDWIYGREPPIGDDAVDTFARSLNLNMQTFASDLESATTRARVDEDLAEGRRNGVTGTPTLFVDGVRYDGAWDFYTLLEALERPVAARVQRSARVFASLPASGGMVLLAAAAVALVLANTPLAPAYAQLIETQLGIGPASGMLSLSVRDWCSEGLLSIFFLLVGLEIRREMTAGALADRRAAALPVIAAFGGVIAPALIYLAINHEPTAHGWAIPTATDIAFTLGILALFGARVPVGLRVFVAALAVIDDVLSVLTLAIFYSRSPSLRWLVGSAVAIALLFALNRARVYRTWPWAIAGGVLWFALQAAGVHGALAGVIVAVFLPTRPAPAMGPLLAQAATALSALEQAESEQGERQEKEALWDWASRNLSAASERLLSPADRIERAVAPWSTYVILPLFAFTATGVTLALRLDTPDSQRAFWGIVLGLVIGKPLGVLVASGVAVKLKLALVPDDVTLRHFVGAACLCGVADTVALLVTDRAFTGDIAELAKIAVLIASTVAGALGSLVLVSGRRREDQTPAALPRSQPSGRAEGELALR